MRYAYLIFIGLGCIGLLQAKNSEVSAYEKELYLTPGGKYTLEDIRLNGNMTRSQKFKDFVSKHNRNPQSGDLVCPITLAKVHPQCSWIIGGKSYQFCSPSCIDAFLTAAKKSPEEIEDPAFYSIPK